MKNKKYNLEVHQDKGEKKQEICLIKNILKIKRIQIYFNKIKANKKWALKYLNRN
jgi:hypothetical protein